MSLRYAILGLLNTKARSGYDLAKTMDKSTMFFWHASQSQIYPELKRLKQEGLVEMEQVINENRPFKQMYYLTDKGKEIFLEWLHKTPKTHIHREPFALQVYLSEELETTVLLSKIRDEAAFHKQQLDNYLEIEQGYLSRSDLYDPHIRGKYIALKNGIAYEKMMIDYLYWAEHFVRNSPNKDESDLVPEMEASSTGVH